MALFNRDPSARALKKLVQRMPQRAVVDLTEGSTV